jgi:hypothetical protein
MSGTKTLLDQIQMDLLDRNTGHRIAVYIDVYDNSLSRKWLTALNHLLQGNYHLEKNYCFVGFADSARNGSYILDQVNVSISAINSADIGYTIDDHFDLNTVLTAGQIGFDQPGGRIIQSKLNHLHRYFEDLQGVSGNIPEYYYRACAETKWHIRQLNLLCHEFESWALSWRKKQTSPQWQRPSQLMCWLNAPRFVLEDSDYELFGIETINRPLGGVFVGVNKAVGKHHYEVFCDEGRDSRINELVTTTLRSQTEAAGDFDIEWANNPGEFEFQKKQLQDFRSWLKANGFDPEDSKLTIGHPMIGQVDLTRSFGTENYVDIWNQLNHHLDVVRITTGQTMVEYLYHWSDNDYIQRQVNVIKGNKNEMD